MKSKRIDVEVIPVFLENESDIDEGVFAWAYCVMITNKRAEPVVLRSRRWSIVDERGALRQIKGDGVVGEQPTILPNATYSYTSGATLNAPSGFMFGEYNMFSEKNGDFSVMIPIFSLDNTLIKPVLC